VSFGFVSGVGVFWVLERERKIEFGEREYLYGGD
jgi:hypothetical protein